MTHDTWVVVANSSVARMMKYAGPHQPLSEVDTLTHPPSRLHDRDLKSDRPGSAFDRVGSGRHAETSSVTPTQHQAELFAVDVAARLREARTHQRFDSLILIAAPAFLGTLREHLDGVTRQQVIREIDKNLVHEPPERIQAQLKH